MSNKITPLRKAKWVCESYGIELSDTPYWSWKLTTNNGEVGVWDIEIHGHSFNEESQALLDAKNFCKVNGFKARFEK